MSTQHWDDEARRTPMADPLPGRVDEHARRIEAAILARSIEIEQRSSRDHGVRNQPRFIVPDRPEPMVSRDRFGRLVVTWPEQGVIDWSSPDAGGAV